MFAEREFGLYELHLFCLVSETGSFTRAGERAGLTQSAVSRQIQRMEETLGVPLFQRTTRRVVLTVAGADLKEEAARLLGEFDSLRRRFEEKHGAAPKSVRVGVSRSIGTAYLPGFYVAFQKEEPDCRIVTEHGDSEVLLQRLRDFQLDVVVCAGGRRWPVGVEEAYRFSDECVAIGPAGSSTGEGSAGEALFRELPLLLMSSGSRTGHLITAWLEERYPGLGAASELDSFDLIVNLVALGGGVSIVPRRVLAPYRRMRKFQTYRLEGGLARMVSAVCRKDPRRPPHVKRFIEKILF